MILLIDNYDSFTYNLFQMLKEIVTEVKVVRNDEISLEEIEQLKPEGIVLSPGPGRPSEAGICIDVVKRFGAKIPILGVCLGHQAICEAYGGVISYAKELMHGKQSLVILDRESTLFRGVSEKLLVGRYHSLALLLDTLPKELKVTGITEDGEIMAVEHNKYPIYGLQFHPESILTPEGSLIIKNFCNRKGGCV